MFIERCYCLTSDGNGGSDQLFAHAVNERISGVDDVAIACAVLVLEDMGRRVRSYGWETWLHRSCGAV
jgi:hypothetical protein